ncbi:DsbA family protein [Kitasatospora sp. NPDC059646]|uniref:DsbA family protein n=1 Tax=Kitasatospora sp. NPDC059646 TaxID=3346893 RepID=UPI00369C61C5
MKPLLRTTVLLAVAGGLLTAPAAATAAPVLPTAPHGLAGSPLLTPGQYLTAKPASGLPAQHLPGAQNPPAAPHRPADGPQAARMHEAVEFFWYNCSHSAALEAPLAGWAARHQGDVTLRRVPAVWPGSPGEAEQRAHARLFYTLDRLGEVDRRQAAVFHAVREEHLDLTTEQGAADWAAAQGLDAAAFRTAYHSAEVDRAVDQAPKLFADNRVTELPTVIVDGTGRTYPTRAGGVERMPDALDRMVTEQRAADPAR